MYKIDPKGNGTQADVVHFERMNEKYEQQKDKQDLSCTHPMTQIGHKYREFTDKVPTATYWRKHTYSEFYGPLFEHLRNEPIRILEVGVRWGGSTLMLWEYFPNAEIWALDTNLKQIRAPMPDSARLHLIQANAYDEKAVSKLLGDTTFHIALDDGSHREADQISFFNIYSKRLAKGGYLLCEDFATRGQAVRVLDGVQVPRNRCSIIDRTECIPAGRDEYILMYH